MEIVYQITVNGLESKFSLKPIAVEEKRVLYPITFRILKKQNIFQVWCYIESEIPNLHIDMLCSSFTSKEQALMYLRNAAKLAMKGKFIFKICSICKGVTPYTGIKEEIIFCPHCEIIFLEEEWQITKMLIG